MGIGTTFLKSLAAASSNNICASQSGSAGVALLLNGSAGNYLSTTTTAAAAAGTQILTLSSVTGLVPGQPVTDSTTAAIPQGTTIIAVNSVSSTVTLSNPIGGPGVGNGDTIVFAGTATIDSATSNNTALGRRVVIAYTGTDTSFTIVGTNATGNKITDTAVGSGGSAQSNLDFVTVTSITPVGGGLTGVTAGTNGVGSSPWWLANWHGYAPVNISVAVEIVSGSVNYTIQYTYDDPNSMANGLTYPIPFNDPVLVNESTTMDGLAISPIKAARVLINSGTGVIRCRFTQAGAG